MKRFVSSCFTALALFGFVGCSLFHSHSSAKKPSAATAGQPTTAGQPSPSNASAPNTAPQPAPAPVAGTAPTAPAPTLEPTPIAESPPVPEPVAATRPAPPPPPAAKAKPAATVKLKAQTETLTGKVVLAKAGYRLKLAADDSGKLFRLTRGTGSRYFAGEQIDLRKYYEKTIVVRGKREDDWIWSAEIIGQWNKPGESRGPNRLAPPMPNR